MYSKGLPSLKVQRSVTTFQAIRACMPLSNNMFQKMEPYLERSVILSNVMQLKWNISQMRPQFSLKEITCLENRYQVCLHANLVALHIVKKMVPILKIWKVDLPLLVLLVLKKLKSPNKIFTKTQAI